MQRKERKKRGYTMAEVLIVIAILGILAALAIPSVITYRRDLKLTELDDNARTIYLAAQNNLAALRSAAAGDKLELDGAGRKATAVPSDVSDLVGAELQYVSTDDPSTNPDWLVLPGSVDSALREAGSCYLVEFDPASGVVYGVFYTETGDGRPLTEATYHIISDPDKNCRVREGRNAFATASDGFLLGYYGADGELDLSRPDAQTLPKPRLKLTNAEELALEITAKAEGEIDASRVFYAISLSDDTNAKTIVAKAKFNDGATNTVVLDTLKTTYTKTPENAAYGGWTIGSPFAGWVQESGIVPGADITVTVTLWYDPASGEGLAALPQSASVKTNSLFAARSGEHGQTAQVSYGRHLQNLNTATSQPDSAITAAIQTRDIDFAKTTPANDKDTRQHWAETYPATNGARTFTAINNANLRHFDGQGRTIANMNATSSSAPPYAGLFARVENGMTVENVTLSDARVTSPVGAGALAGFASNATVRNCRVYLTKADATARVSAAYGTAGGLIGQSYQSVTIENCFAATVVKGGSQVGGLVGRGNTLKITNSYAACHLTGSGYVGGLVGGLENNAAQVNIQNSYAAGCIASAVTEAAGLVALHPGTTQEYNQITIQNAYAAVDYGSVPTSDKVFGTVRVGHCTNVSYLIKPGVNDAVTPAGVTAFNDSTLMQARSDLGLGAPFIDGENTGVKTRPYNLVERTETEGPLAGPLSAPYPYPTLRLTIHDEATLVPHYGDWLEAVAPPAPKSLVAYYEQFDGVTEYACFVNGVEQGTLDLSRTGAINADGYAFLSPEKLHDNNNAWAKLTVNAAGMETRESTVQCRFLDTLDEDFQKTADEEAIAYYVYAIPTTAIDVVPDASGYGEFQFTINRFVPGHQLTEPPWWVGDQWVVDESGVTAWVNPLFGRAAYNGAKPSDASEIHIRSLRQLANIGRFFGDKRSYIQDLDIDAAIYYGDLAFDKDGKSLAGESRTMNAAGHLTVAGFEMWARSYDKSWGYVADQWNVPADYRLIFSPIGTHGTPGDAKNGYDKVSSFNGDYNGNGRIIRALSIRSHYYDEDKVEHAGLFHRVRGTLTNIHLADCDVVGATGTSTGSTGMLAARLSGGLVKDCTVTNCAVTAEGTKAGGHMGGLIGYVDNKGSVSGCTVENCIVTGGAYIRNVGGLTGNVYKLSSDGAIRDCTVKNVQVTGRFSNEKADSVEKQGSVGGFVGCLKDNQGTLDRCYVIGTGDLRVSGTGPYTGGFVGVMDNTASGAVQNCGVRLEGKVKTGYDAQRVAGGKYVGGFAGTIAGGSVTASYAAIGVDGVTSGGFAGVFSGGAVTNSYAAGRTKSGKFSAASPNVTGTDMAGGLVGSWSGGTLDTCYTTCAVSGVLEAKTDVFANTDAATLSAPVPNCYALGEAFVNGAKYGNNLNKANVATKLAELAEEERTETHPYDSTLEDIPYPYAPVHYAAGGAVPHYGDWPYTVNRRPGFEWTPTPEPPENFDQTHLQSAEALWTEAGLKLTIDTIDSTLNDLFNSTGGTFTVSSDLGEVLNLKAEFAGGGSVRITDSAGNVWEITPTIIGSTPGGQPIRSYEFTIPSSSLPPYLETLNLGGFKQGDLIDEIKYRGKPEGFQPEEAFVPGDEVVIDGSFEDWNGYPHQILNHNSGEGSTSLTTNKGAAFGDGNMLYLHLHVARPANLVPDPSNPGALNGIQACNMGCTITDKQGKEAVIWGNFTWSEENSEKLPEGWSSSNYYKPGLYSWYVGGNSPAGDWLQVPGGGTAYIRVNADGTQDMEMLIDLETILGSEAAAKTIVKFRADFGTLGGSLTIWRDPPED